MTDEEWQFQLEINLWKKKILWLQKKNFFLVAKENFFFGSKKKKKSFFVFKGVKIHLSKTEKERRKKKEIFSHVTVEI